ncbi:MAG TPA: hypothetical protein DD671_17235, partial [Balneolaceae bacterium]|nr:hypothetical protein [Balneolaceae bacterium]
MQASQYSTKLCRKRKPKYFTVFQTELFMNLRETKMKKLITLFVLVAFGFTVQAQEKGSVLIQNATVITVTNGDLEDTDVLIRDGIIEEIGKDLRAPRGVETVDASGKFVMPGIIDAHSHLNGVDINEARNPVTAEVTMEESV